MLHSAVAILENSTTTAPIYGEVYFEELTEEGTRIYGFIEGASPGLHGFHIHEYGDLTNGCESMGSHYNPRGQFHGSRVTQDRYGQIITNFDRHVGDLGNLEFDNQGRVEFDFVDYLVDIRNIIGRGIVLHENTDDLGRPGREAIMRSLTLNDYEFESLNTGNAGGRIACGIIGICPTH